MARTAERLLILREVGEGLMSRLSWTKKILETPSLQPELFSDPQYKKLIAVVDSKFPAFDTSMEKTPGFDVLSGKSKQFFEQLEGFYYCLVDSFIWKEQALPVIRETLQSVNELKIEDNPSLTIAFMNVMTLYATLNYLVNSLESRKAVASIYQKLFFLVKCTQETNFARISTWIQAFQDPAKAMQEELKAVAPNFGKSIVNVVLPYSRMRNIPTLRSEGTLNITSKPEDLPKPVTDKFIFAMSHGSEMFNWIVWGFLLFPDALAVPGCMDLLKNALSEAYCFPVWRGVSTNLHPEYDNLWNNYKGKAVKFSDFKKVPKDAQQDSLTKAPYRHRERRIYIRQEMNSLVHLFTSQPALIGPKFQILLTILSLAKEEVMWYFRHIAKPQIVKNKKGEPEDYKDSRISSLIFLIDQLSTLAKTHKASVQQYFLEYMGGADSAKLSELINGQAWTASVGPAILEISKSIISTLKSISPERIGELKTLRLNWMRIETALTSASSPVPLPRVKEVVDRFVLAINHARYVDDFDGLLEEAGCLKDLWYLKDVVVDSFTRAIKDNLNQPSHAGSYLRLYCSFCENATMWTPEEQLEIGPQVVALVENACKESADRLGILLHEIAKNYIIYDFQYADEHAAHPLIQEKMDAKHLKDLAAPVTPGSESAWSNVFGELEKLRRFEKNCWQLCSALNEIETLVVFDHVIAPREYLRDKLKRIMRDYIRSSVQQEVTDEKTKTTSKQFQRPTLVEKKIRVYVTVLKLVQQYIDIDVDDAMREVFLSEFWIPALGKTGNLDWINVEETEIAYGGPPPIAIAAVVQYYSDFVSKKLQQPGIVWSPARKSFVSKTGMAFRAENFADIVELRALASLVGPYGFKLIEREVLKFILQNVNGLKDYLAANKDAVEEFSRTYVNEATLPDTLKKVKDLDNFVLKSIAIGNALCFRDLMHEALRQVNEERVPFIYNTLTTAYNQYKRNTFLLPALIPVDCMAADSGIDPQTADQSLKMFLRKSVGSADAPLWDLLPFMYALSFHSNVWKDSTYKSILEAHTNNIHVLAKTINSLTIAFKAITSPQQDERVIFNLQKSFLDVASLVLLRMAKQNDKDKKAPVDYPSMVIFLDLFVETSPLLTRDILEKSVPYALLRQHWRAIFSSKVNNIKKSVSQGEIDVF